MVPLLAPAPPEMLFASSELSMLITEEKEWVYTPHAFPETTLSRTETRAEPSAYTPLKSLASPFLSITERAIEAEAVPVT